MVFVCAVANCNNNNKIKRLRGDSLVFHNFPKNTELVKQWVIKCRRKDKPNPQYWAVCSDHFTDADYERDLRNELLGLPTRKVLKPTAIPSVFKSPNIHLVKNSSAREKRISAHSWRVQVKEIIMNSNMAHVNVNQMPLVSHVKLEPGEHSEEEDGQLKVVNVFSVDKDPFGEIWQTTEANQSLPWHGHYKNESRSSDSRNSVTATAGTIKLGGRNSTMEKEVVSNKDNMQKGRRKLVRSKNTPVKKAITLSCELCSSIFTSIETLEEHVIDVHVVDKEFHCPQCSKSFICQEKLKSHMLEHEKNESADYKMNAQETDDYEIFHCEYCMDNFKTQKSLRHHKSFCSIRILENKTSKNDVRKGLLVSLQEVGESLKIKTDIRMLALNVLGRDKKNKKKLENSQISTSIMQNSNEDYSSVAIKIEPQEKIVLNPDQQLTSKVPIQIEQHNKMLLVPHQESELVDPLLLPKIKIESVSIQEEEESLDPLPSQRKQVRSVSNQECKYPLNLIEPKEEVVLPPAQQKKKSVNCLPSKVRKRKVISVPIQYYDQSVDPMPLNEPKEEIPSVPSQQKKKSSKKRKNEIQSFPMQQQEQSVKPLPLKKIKEILSIPTPNKLKKKCRGTKPLKQYKCEICGESLHNTVYLNKHMKSHEQFVENTCNKSTPGDQDLTYSSGERRNEDIVKARLLACLHQTRIFKRKK